MTGNQRRCRICKRAWHIDEMIECQPEWSLIISQPRPARVCARCAEWLWALWNERKIQRARLSRLLAVNK
jgi:hypothetical protein